MNQGSAAEVCRRRGSCRSSRWGRTVPRHVRRQGREARGHAAAAGRRSLLRSRRASACPCSACLCSACLRLHVCLDRVRRCACRVSCHASAANSWPCARRSRGACAVWAMSHTRASRNFDFGFEVRGERGRRVCRTSCVCVCGLMLSSVCFAYFAYFAYFACRPNSVAERGTHTQR